MTRFASRQRAETFSALVDATASTRAGGTDAETARLLGVVSQLRAGAQVLEAAGCDRPSATTSAPG